MAIETDERDAQIDDLHDELRAIAAERDALLAENGELRESLDRHLAHVWKLEDRIRRQRARLRWWEDGFMRRIVISNRRYGWTASRVCDLLRRLGSPHRVDAACRESRRVTARAATNEPRG